MALTAQLGSITLCNPFILAASPATASAQMIERAFRAGWAGAVIQTLPADEPDRLTNVSPRIRAVRGKQRVIAFASMDLGSNRTATDWQSDITMLKRKFPDRALIVSLLHGSEPEQKQWHSAAALCQRAGADALEINASSPHLLAADGGDFPIANRPHLLRQVITWVRDASRLPIMVKLPLTCEFTEIAAIAKAAGASVLTAIDAVTCLPGIDVETDTPLLAVNGKGTLAVLSGRAIKPLALGAVARLRTMSRLPICGAGGVYDGKDAVEFILAGASAVQVCSSVMEHGYSLITQLNEGLYRWLDSRNVKTIKSMVGKALPKLVPHRDLDRSWVGKAHCIPEKCVRCGICATSCRDAGAQAIFWERGLIPKINKTRCEGCGLCTQVCPTASLHLSPVE